MTALNRRGPWSQQEDGYLMSLVQNQGALNWVRIAQTLGSRTPKQCRERYHQNLKPTLNHEPITPEEGAQIEALVRGLGKRWAEIARRLNGRSDNAVKNWWNGSQNRRKRMDRRRGSHHSHSLRYEHHSYPEHTLSGPSVLLSSTSGRLRPPPFGAPLPPLHCMPGHYSVASPLPSPSSTGSPGSDMLEHPGYLSADSSPGFSSSASGPCEGTTSRAYESIDLPPLLNLNRPAGIQADRGLLEPRLPGLDSVLPRRGGSTTPDDDVTRCVPAAGAQLPTAPSSPVHDWSTQRGHPATSPAPSESSKDSRMHVAALLM